MKHALVKSSLRPPFQSPGHLPEQPFIARTNQENLVQTGLSIRAESSRAGIQMFSYPGPDGIEIRRSIGIQPICVRMIGGWQFFTDQVAAHFSIDPGAWKNGRENL